MVYMQNQDLFDACEDGNVAQVMTLLSQGADPNYHNIREMVSCMCIRIKLNAEIHNNN